MLGTPWKGYYLTAYGIAVKHGFVGTEEEWLLSLEGKPGAGALLRYNKTAKAIEWKPEGADTWTEIVPLSELQGELVSATLKGAEDAASMAGSAKADAMAAADAAKKDAEEAADAEKKILQHIQEYGTTVKKAYVSGDELYIQTSDGKVFAAGNVRGPRGDGGKNAYEIAVEHGYEDTEEEWNNAVNAARVEAQRYASQAMEAVGKTNYIGENGNWYAWDSAKNAFYDTGVRARAGSIVYYGTNPPEDADVWIDPEGEEGRAPTRGVDYWTEEDKAEIVNDVLDALPDGNGRAY